MANTCCIKGLAQSNEKDEVFYDEVYANSEKYSRHFLNSPYYPIYSKTLEILVIKKSKVLLEAGCGCGTFSSMLTASKFPIEYCGFDFSSVGVEKAREKCPNYIFLKDNIYTTNLFDSYPYDTIVSHEVLEHLKDDLGFLRRIRPGTLFIGSVPRFDSQSHVRYFTHEQQVIFRYKNCINIEDIIALNNMYLFYGMTLGSGTRTNKL